MTHKKQKKLHKGLRLRPAYLAAFSALVVIVGLAVLIRSMAATPPASLPNPSRSASQSASEAAEQSEVSADVNGDGVVNYLDVSLVTSNNGKSGNREQGDLSGDGKVDHQDISILADGWEQ